MASLIEGYKYDIFISYRQKDNKGDRWVSEFVEALKTELESTFKEEINVYFDINPHDGLLETHDVDASLKEKLKCAVFIPIISRTYCDPKSFAWVHEFKSFIEQASKDKFGLKIKLPGGNIASRVLPVQIHDLDAEDKKLVESELGGFLRGVEFIFKSPGVNRPLLVKEENPLENLNRTNYRDQLNKVANAIKEIITGLRNPEREEKGKQQDTVGGIPHLPKNQKTKIIAGALIILGLIMAGYFIVPELFKPEEVYEKSIAVLPFYNYSGDPGQEYMSDGLTDEIINHLYKIKSFDKVVSLSSVLTYKGTAKKIPRIADELKVNYLLEGTYKKIGDQVRVTAQLIEPKNDKHLWQQEYDQPYKEIISIQSDIALQIAANLNAFLTSSEKQIIEKIPTINQEAYELIQKALYNTRSETSIDVKPTLDLILKAIELDPSYADAYAFAGIMTLYTGVFAGTRGMSAAIVDSYDFFQKALELDPNNGSAHFGMGHIYEWGRWDYIKAEKEYLKSIEGGPNRMNEDWGYFLIGEFFLKMNQLDEALTYLKKSKNIQTARSSDLILRIKYLTDNKNEAQNILKSSFPKTGREFIYKSIGADYIWMEEYDSAKLYLESAINSNDPFMLVPKYQAYLALAYNKTGDHAKARTILSKLKNLSMETTAGSPDFFTGWYYSGIGEIDSAFLWLEKSYRNKSPELPVLKIDPVFSPLRNDPRYWDLYKRTGHLAYDENKSALKNY
jgi:TolB-like protein/Tfp pilus assembly protein PilF